MCFSYFSMVPAPYLSLPMRALEVYLHHLDPSPHAFPVSIRSLFRHAAVTTYHFLITPPIYPDLLCKREIISSQVQQSQSQLSLLAVILVGRLQNNCLLVLYCFVLFCRELLFP